MQHNNLAQACINFVEFKDHLDKKLSTNGRLRKINPSSFILFALPFSNQSFNRDSKKYKTIDPFFIISGTYNHYPIVPLEKEKEILDGLNRIVDAENGNYDLEAPHVSQVGSMPLYISHEGKNRVDLFKKHNHPMKVFVTCKEYPSPSEMTIIKYIPSGSYTLCYKKEISLIPYPEVTLPLLRAYGVNKETIKLSFSNQLSIKKLRSKIEASIMYK